MSLKEQLLADLKEAMNKIDTVHKAIIYTDCIGMLQINLTKKIELEYDSILNIIAKNINKFYMLPDFEKNGSQDLIKRLNNKIKILESYLPVQLTKLNNQYVLYAV